MQKVVYHISDINTYSCAVFGFQKHLPSGCLEKRSVYNYEVKVSYKRKLSLALCGGEAAVDWCKCLFPKTE